MIYVKKKDKKNEILLEKDKTKNLSLFDIIYKKYLSNLLKNYFFNKNAYFSNS